MSHTALEPGLAARDLGKVFESRHSPVTALEGVDLRTDPGEFVSLLGPSGCGKSTLLRLFAGLDEASSGSISVHGLEPDLLRRRHGIGVAFQDASLLPWRSVQSNIRLAFEVSGRVPGDGEIERLVELVGLTAFSGSRPSQLSGGMRQRVSLARALAMNPEVLLLDEPFGALDQMTRHTLNLELQKIWSEKSISTLLVTHSIEEAVFLSDRVARMAAGPGRIVEIVDIALPRPRTAGMMHSASFHALCDHLSQGLFGR